MLAAAKPALDLLFGVYRDARRRKEEEEILKIILNAASDLTEAISESNHSALEIAEAIREVAAALRDEKRPAKIIDFTSRAICPECTGSTAA